MRHRYVLVPAVAQTMRTPVLSLHMRFKFALIGMKSTWMESHSRIKYTNLQFVERLLLLDKISLIRVPLNKKRNRKIESTTHIFLKYRSAPLFLNLHHQDQTRTTCSPTRPSALSSSPLSPPSCSSPLSSPPPPVVRPTVHNTAIPSSI